MISNSLVVCDGISHVLMVVHGVFCNLNFQDYTIFIKIYHFVLF